MSSANRLMQFLSASQAADWWGELTGEQINPAELVLLFGDTRRDIYLNCTNINGGKTYEVEEGKTVWLEVQARGYCRAMFPTDVVDAMNGDTVQTHVVGPGMAPTKISENLIPDNSSARLFKDLDWVVTLNFENCHPLFRPADIESLAAKNNSLKSRSGIRHRSTKDAEKDAEIEKLRQELEQECAAREAAEQRAKQAEAKSKPLDPRERATLERLVYVLAIEAKVGPKDETSVKRAAELKGLQGLSGKGTITKHLKAAFERGEKERQV